MTVVSRCDAVPSIVAVPGGTAPGPDTGMLSRMQHDMVLLECVTRIAARDDVEQGFHDLADFLQQWLGARQVALGITAAGRRRCRVKALSGMRAISRQSPVVRAIEAVMDEALLRGELDAQLFSSAKSRQATVLQNQLARATDSTLVVSGPVRDGTGESVGAWVVIDDRSPGGAAAMAETIRSAQQRLGLCLCILSRPHRRSVASRLSQLLRRKHRARLMVMLIAAAVCCALLALPMPYKVACKCTVQPVTRRFVVAPYEGTLKEAFVEPGDLVTSGQVLARMDEREIQWELAGLAAEASRAQKQRDADLAGLDTVAAQLSLLEMQRLQVTRHQLQNRARNLEIRSPVDGVVISGDPKKMEGARLAVGQNLLEIGPLDQMVVQVSVPDEEIAHVEVGQQVSLRFEAQPTRQHRGKIRNIHPRAVTEDQTNVFIAEARLVNHDGTLRPGMDGRARVRTDRHPWGWNLFHKVWYRLAFRLGW